MIMKYPTTKKTLIDKLRDGDSVSWDEFYERYNGIIHNVGEAKGLTEDECNDLVQEVMLRFFHNSKTFKFDPNIARFRTYFGKIVSGKIIDIMRRRLTTKADFTLEEELALGISDAPDVINDKIFLAQWRSFMLQQAREILRSRVEIRTYQAFEFFAEQGRDIKRVSMILDMSPNQIYVAKNRCINALHNILVELNEADPGLELLKNEI